VYISSLGDSRSDKQCGKPGSSSRLPLWVPNRSSTSGGLGAQVVLRLRCGHLGGSTTVIVGQWRLREPIRGRRHNPANDADPPGRFRKRATGWQLTDKEPGQRISSAHQIVNVSPWLSWGPDRLPGRRASSLASHVLALGIAAVAW
jgi:hypothetical protein